ncbi:DUF805 domain-containing protein [Paenarthrobacter nitroguajacolicus]|uniref:DUF805 domain-containing protein n=1 Tax=Paenarthrobacter nitroguajacolicus TaxID=211146 RepID=UPI00248B76FA|nr:DUF805 domain-containing protein [Paenarthrobacter nitroguajacolicus]
MDMKIVDPAGGGVAEITGSGVLDGPLYGASFGKSVKRFFAKYAKFAGRASRSEFWWSQLFVFLVMVVPYLVTTVGLVASIAWAQQNPNVQSMGFDPATGQEVFYEAPPGVVNAPTGSLMVVGFILVAVLGLALLVPQLSLLWRRLHDANLAGPLALVGLVPLVGGLIVFVLALMPTKAEGRRFDPR